MDKRMRSILQRINELHVRDWYYYYQVSGNKLKSPFKNKIGHLNFIKKYFRRSGKEKVLQKFDVNNFLPDNAPHTNSVFFLGAVLYYNTIFKNYIDNSLTLKGYRLFPFIWFLITLFHDFGYKYEKEFQKYKHIVDIETLKKELNIKYSLLNLKNVKGVSPTLYNSVRKYFLYRRFNSIYGNKIDHGILAGLFYYDALLKNRIEQYNNKKNDDLSFGPELNRIYAQAAVVIATHNIWFPNKKTNSEYSRFGLDELVGLSPIKLKDSPLLTLLGIVDTIDPVKIYSNKLSKSNSYIDILDNILINLDERKIVLKNSVNSKLDFSKIAERSKNLEGWLDVKLNPSNDLIVIELN
jgi:hypothetical protein